MHGIYRVTSLDDGTKQKINFEPVLSGDLYGPLRDHNLFNQVQIDSEVHTIVWPNGPTSSPRLYTIGTNWQTNLSNKLVGGSVFQPNRPSLNTAFHS
jgi:hypothetical protein